MQKPKLSLKNLNYLYIFINLISYAIIIGVIVFIINDCYHLYLKENTLFQQTKAANLSTTQLDHFLKTTLTSIIFGIVKIILTILVVFLIKFCIFKIPMSSRYLIALDKNNAISAILGRYLCYHFRKNHSINFQTLVYLNQEAEYEKYIIEQHSKKNQFDYFLKKYDDSYENDLK